MKRDGDTVNVNDNVIGLILQVAADSTTCSGVSHQWWWRWSWWCRWHSHSHSRADVRGRCSCNSASW